MSDSNSKPKAPEHTKEAEELAQGRAKNVKVKNIRLRAIYSYDAKMADELTLRADNEYIGIRLLEPEENWWYGTTVDSSRAGIFPANYVEVIQEATRVDSKKEGTMNPIAVSEPDDGSVKTAPEPGCCCTVS